MQSYSQQHPESTAKHAFEYFNNGECPWTNRTFCGHSHRIRNILKRDNNINTSCASLTPNQQIVINIPTTGDINDIITLSQEKFRSTFLSYVSDWEATWSDITKIHQSEGQ